MDGGDIELLLCAAMIELHRAKGSGAGGIVEIKDGQLGTTIRTDAAKNHLAEAARLEVELKQLLPLPSRRPVL